LTKSNPHGFLRKIELESWGLMPRNYYGGMKGAEVSNNPEQIRSFIAIELPGEVREGLARLRKELERDVSQAEKRIGER